MRKPAKILRYLAESFLRNFLKARGKSIIILSISYAYRPNSTQSIAIKSS